MSGHSKWSTIKRKKAKTDAQRGKIFTKVIKEITVAARKGGGDESTNPALRSAIANAKAANMPAANIERAIKKGTGELPGVSYDEVFYEGYGPGGTALLIEVLTDNKNRTVAEIRHFFSKYDGNTWGYPKPLTSNSYRDFQPNVNYNNNGQPEIVWISGINDKNIIQYSRLKDGEWVEFSIEQTPAGPIASNIVMLTSEQ